MRVLRSFKEYATDVDIRMIPCALEVGCVVIDGRSRSPSKFHDRELYKAFNDQD